MNAKRRVPDLLAEHSVIGTERGHKKKLKTGGKTGRFPLLRRITSSSLLSADFCEKRSNRCENFRVFSGVGARKSENPYRLNGDSNG
jgi:hypothetical protein